MGIPFAAATLALTLVAGAASASTITFSGTRTNISPGADPAGRCAPGITVNFAPTAFSAGGTSSLGNFAWTGSHCLAGPPPGDYFDGIFEWAFAEGSLLGTYSGTLTGIGPGVLGAVESIVFTGGTGAFSGWSGFATATGTVTLGQFEGQFATFGDFTFEGELTVVPEPLTWTMMIAGFGLVGMALRRRTAVLA